MRSRTFGPTGRSVGEIGFGAWAIGAAWGAVDDNDSVAALHAALDAGLDFIDTADVYGDGHSERLIARVLKERGGERPFVATKAGRRLPQQTVAGYSAENLEGWIDRSLRNLEVDVLDLLQLHCPPTDAYYHPEVFERMERLVERGKIRHYGVSVERVEEALKAIEYPGVASVQIIYNMFRLRPAELFFREARRRNVAVIVRVPLASGLLSGKFTRDTRFAADDHRQFNRHGEAFDVGETFSGVPYEVGLSNSGKAACAGARGRDPSPAGAALDPDGRSGDRSHPGRAHSGTGAGQCRRGRAAGTAAGDDGRGRPAVRPWDIRPYVHQRW